ncbi:MAG TPA: HAMP domain-containing sensor histidine kinase [Bryobacteraceae bacterium]|nr:HAMP domain-containing sensor histidine kinase [Bryobacteraceae bacterium]
MVAILFFGYRLTREWQREVAARITRQNEESADLILKAITRDMRGAQARILANRDWDAPLPDGSARDMTEQVATTFARYPYPESFFTWRGGHHSMLFFNRTTRLPKWMPEQSTVARSPISLAIDPPVAEQVRQQVSSATAEQLRYAIFNTELAGVPYQFVARITYADSLREHLESVSGFTVNLAWVRKWYFSDILTQIGPSARGGLSQDVALLDENGRTVWGSNNDRGPVAERTFPLLFMDSSDSASDIPPGLTNVKWTLRVSASRDPVLLGAAGRADSAFVATSLAVILCGASLILTHKAVLSGVKLTEMRSRFVSSVTHELKTPLANIHALAATLARQPQIPADRYREYPNLLIQETKSLGRLVDNLLAYARITDVTETYAFEAIAAAELLDDAVRSFRPRLSESGIRVQFDVSPDLPFVYVDQRAIMLALNNLIDNAIRHVRNDGRISISTRCVNSVVCIEVQDDGCGISAARLAALKASIASRAFSPSDGGGLGLAIASKVVADHGGTFTVESALGMGTRCVIGLPAC